MPTFSPKVFILLTISASAPTEAAPEAQQEAVASAREKLVEMVAESNEALMEEFFEKGTLPQEDLVKGLREAVALCQERGAVVWTNRLPPSLLEGCESLIQDPEKILDEVRAMTWRLLNPKG